jgi:hypothetical protein
LPLQLAKVRAPMKFAGYCYLICRYRNKNMYGYHVIGRRENCNKKE